MSTRGRWQRCAACRQLPHRPENCLGRDAGCCCQWCPDRWRDIIADARELRAPSPTEAELLRIAEWKLARQVKARAYRRYQPRCQGPGCGNQVGALRYGRMRKFCSPACRQRAWRTRRKSAGNGGGR